METTRIERNGGKAVRMASDGPKAVDDAETPAEKCPGCQAEIPANAPMGLCPSCLLGSVTDSSGSSSRGSIPPGSMVGSHQVLWLIDSGGQGEVYEARDLRTGRNVALKMLIEGAQPILFLKEIKAFAKLDHPNIVTAYEAGEHHGRHYFTMKLMKGGSLRKNVKKYRDDPRGAAELIEKVAWPVRHLHQHGILHRDLKPANILLDQQGEPHVADFGVAKHAGDDGQFACTGTVAGSLPYMAPEQHFPDNPADPMQPPTWAADVYSLGVILYELITGKKPFDGETEQDIAQAKKSPPISPRKINPKIDRDLERICLRCIEKHSERRYASAHALAQALRRYLEGKAQEGAGWVEHVWCWCLRHTVATGPILTLVTFLVIMTPTTISFTREQETATRARIRQTNINSAAMVAGTVLSQIRALSDAVERAASDQNLAQHLERGDDAALNAFCEWTYKFYEDPTHGLKLNGNSPFDMWWVLDTGGVLRAVYGAPGRLLILGKEYPWRDYFRGAWKLREQGRRSSYVSRVIKSENDGNYKFAISAPIYGSEGRPIGVLVSGVAAAANLGSLILDNPQSTAVLIAPRDRDRSDPKPESPYLVLRHPAIAYGEGIGMDNAEVRMLDAASSSDAKRIERPLGLPSPDLVMSSDAYEDPVAIQYPQYAGRWVAGFAPVGNTGFVVVVQTLEDETFGPEFTLGRELLKWGVISAVPGAFLVIFVTFYRRLRRVQPRRSRLRSQDAQNVVPHVGTTTEGEKTAATASESAPSSI